MSINFRAVLTSALLITATHLSAAEFEQPSFSRWFCSEAIKILGLKAGLIEGVPQIRTKNLGNIRAADSQRLMQHVLQLDTFTDTPVIYQFFLPPNVRPAQGLGRLLTQAQKLQAPASITTVRESGDAVLYSVTIPQDQDFTGQSMDKNIAVSSLGPIFSLVDSSEIVEVADLDGEIANEIRQFFAGVIRSHFQAIQRGDREDFEKTLARRLKNVSPDLRDQFRGTVESVILDPDILSSMAAYSSDRYLQSPGRLILPPVFAGKVSSSDVQDSLFKLHGPMFFNSYLMTLLESREVRERFRKVMMAHAPTRQLMGENIRVAGYSLKSFQNVANFSAWYLTFAIRFRSVDDDDNDEGEGTVESPSDPALLAH